MPDEGAPKQLHLIAVPLRVETTSQIRAANYHQVDPIQGQRWREVIERYDSADHQPVGSVIASRDFTLVEVPRQP